MAELDDVIHQPLRLRIMAALNALPAATGLEFARLKKLTGATDGNLGAHIETLARPATSRSTKRLSARSRRPQLPPPRRAAVRLQGMLRPCRRSLPGSKSSPSSFRGVRH